MIVRAAPLLAAALGCLAVPALAQDEATSPPPLPALDDLAAPEPAEAMAIVPAPLAEPTPEGGWQGEWQGEWVGDGSYRGTWNGTYREPAPTASRAIYPGGPEVAGYGHAERTAWLAQCRNLYYPNSAATGAVVAAQPDVCQSYLEQYERSFAMAAQGGVAPLAGAPMAYAPGYAYPSAPVVWVRVPIVRQPAPAETGE